MDTNTGEKILKRIPHLKREHAILLQNNEIDEYVKSMTATNVFFFVPAYKTSETRGMCCGNTLRAKREQKILKVTFGFRLQLHYCGSIAARHY